MAGELAMLAALVVGGVVRAIAIDQLVERRTIGIMRHDQWADFGAQEMIGAGGAERRQIVKLLRIDEFQHLRRIDEMADLDFVL